MMNWEPQYVRKIKMYVGVVVKANMDLNRIGVMCRVHDSDGNFSQNLYVVLSPFIG